MAEREGVKVVRKYGNGRGDVENCLATDNHVITLNVSVEDDYVTLLRYEAYFLTVWDKKGDGEKIGTFNDKGTYRIDCMCITQDQKELITGHDRSINLWKISNQENVRTFRGHSSEVLSVDTYGDLLVSGDADGVLILWSISKGDRLQDFRGHTGYVGCARFSSFDGKTVFSGSGDKTVIRWKVSDGAQIMKYEGGHTKGVSSLAVTRDDSKLITGSHDHTCIIWNVLSGARLNIFRGHSGWVVSVALSPCERYAASGSGGRTIIWDIAKAKQIHVLTSGNAFTFTGPYTLITAGDRGTAIEFDTSALFKDIPARFALLHAIRSARNVDDDAHASPLSISSTRAYNVRNTAEIRYLMCCVTRFF